MIVKDSQIQYKTPAEIKAFQEARLAEALAYLQAHSKFYQRMFADNHIDISKIRTIEDLRQIPVTTKTDLQMHNDEFLCVDKADVIDYVTTSGTMGNPVTFALTLRPQHNAPELSNRSQGADDKIQRHNTLSARIVRYSGRNPRCEELRG